MLEYVQALLPSTHLNGGRLKWQMLSAHDSNVASLQTALNITSAECLYDEYRGRGDQHLQCKVPPRYTANLIMEFHESEDQTEFVKVRYNGEYVFLCEKAETQCDLNEFWSRINTMLKKNPFRSENHF